MSQFSMSFIDLYVKRVERTEYNEQFLFLAGPCILTPISERKDSSFTLSRGYHHEKYCLY